MNFAEEAKPQNPRDTPQVSAVLCVSSFRPFGNHLLSRIQSFNFLSPYMNGGIFTNVMYALTTKTF